MGPRLSLCSGGPEVRPECGDDPMASQRWNPPKYPLVVSERFNGSGRPPMANGDGSSGVLGVVVGAMIVIVVGRAILFGTGVIGGNNSSVKVEMPKITTGSGGGGAGK